MDLIENYREELKLVRKPMDRFWVFVLIIVALAFPWFAKEHVIYTATLIFIYGVGILGQNLLIGYTGQLSLGQAGFLAIGAFTFGHLTRLGAPWPLGLLLAGLMAGIFGIIVGIPSLRLKGPYLAIATLGFGIAVYQVFLNSEVLSGGRMGLNIPKLKPFFGLSPHVSNYYFNLVFIIIFSILTFNIISSYLGRTFIAIRDNDIAAEAIGVSLTRYKLLSFGISSFFTGIQGGLYCLFIGFLEPNMFTFAESTTLFVAVIIGGIASVEGSLMGAAFVILVPQLLSNYREMVPVIFGITIIFILIFEPLGLYGRWYKIRLYFRNWPFR